MGTVTCIGCREQLEGCACAQVGKAGQAALLMNQGGLPPPGCYDGPRRCHRCEEIKPIGVSRRYIELCFDCAKGADIPL